MNHSKSEAVHEEALLHIVGGVNSPSRSYKAVGGGSLLQWPRKELISGMLTATVILTI